MKQIIILALLLLFTGINHLLIAQQEDVGEEKSQRQLRREARQAAREIQEQKVLQMLRDTTFVYEISTLYGYRGDSYKLNQLSNFFAIVGDLASIQYAFNHFPGFSGIEGMMNTGRLIAYEVIEPKGNKPILVRGRIEPYSSTSLVIFEMNVQKNGRTRMDMMTGSGRRVILEGDLHIPAESNVFKTLPLFQR